MFNLINPYWLYIKIAAAVLAVSAVIGCGFYVRHVFNDRASLQKKNGSLTEKLETSQENYQGLMQQTQLIVETNQRIVEASRREKANSNIYIAKLEAARLPVPHSGGTVLVPGGLPQTVFTGGVHGFKGYSAGRVAADPP